MAASLTLAEVKPATVFSDGLVLQRDVPAAVWGTATPGAALSLSFAGQTVATTADGAGQWKAVFTAMGATEKPADLTVSGDGPAAVIHNVVVGDVWLCAGDQSLAVKLADGVGGAEAVAAGDDNALRAFAIDADAAPKAALDVRGAWRVASPKTVGDVPAVVYHFAKELRREVGVPIGVVYVVSPGSRIIAWTRRGSIDRVAELKTLLKKADTRVSAATKPYDDATRRSAPGWVYNDAIAPIVGLGIRGFVWSQGQNDVINTAEHRMLLPRLVRDWRQLWENESLPFLFVQLPAIGTAEDEAFGSATADLRLAQTTALDQKFTGMAVTIDTRIGGPTPPDERPIAKRLANLALKIAYGRDIDTAGPMWIGRRQSPGRLLLKFHAPGGLRVPAVEGPLGFMIAGDDRRFVPAEARLASSTKDTIELRAPGVVRPVAVRYGWTTSPTCNVTNAAGIPLAPFRTDDWPTPTNTPPAKPEG